MYIVSVDLRVKPDKVHEFIRLSMDNATHSREEPGCLRFDVLRLENEPDRFLFHEVYMSSDDLKTHQTTEHYARWKSEIEALCKVPRTSEKFTTLDPSPYV